MEENLLAEESEKQRDTWDGFCEEMKRIIHIAGPMMVVSASQNLLQVVTLMMVGHLNNDLFLSSSALAISLATVSGFSLLLGMASGLETICGQAYGAQQYKKFGVQTYTAIFSLTCVCLPLTFLWINMERILLFIGQDPLIAHEAGKFIIWLLPALFANAILQPIVRYFQMQSLILPMLVSSCVTLCIHIPLCWALVFNTGLSNVGGALAMSISIWLNVTFLGLYMRYSSACAKTRAPISMELFQFQGIWQFFRFAIPSACSLEWWSFELLILLSGLLNTITTLFSIPFGISAAASTRISNELGAGNPHAARVAVLAAVSSAIMETAIVSGTLFACSHVFGYVFSNEKEVVDYVTIMAPLVCISVILDSIQGVLTGVARGCGWQNIGVYANLGAFYLCGIPVAASLAFLAKMRGKGLWIGIQIGAFVQCILLSTITSCINWDQQAIKARKRLFDNELSIDNRVRVTWVDLGEEMKRIIHIAVPMVAVNASQYLCQVVTLMMVGHLNDELYLSSAALAISLGNVLGFSLLMGMASGLETICGQAYGAQQYKKIGVQTYTAIFSLTFVCLPLTFLFISMEKILLFMGQDPLIAHEAGKFIIWLLPSLFAYAILQPIVRYFQMQSLIFPMLISSCVTLCIHIPLCWALVFNTGLSNVGGALAMSISIWLNVTFLGLYMRYSSACAKTRAPISMELFQFQGIWEFFRFAIPSVCSLEWWSFELLILLSGLLSTISTLYAIPFGIAGAASTRVSNELGAGNPHAARVAVLVAMFFAVMETAVVSGTLFACRHVFGYIFSNEKEVVDYVTIMVPLISLSVILDSIQGVLAGVARGCGWQHIGVYVNLGAFYLCGIPVAASLAFLAKLGGKGLWIGVQVGAFVQCILLSTITSCINWEQQAIKARKRLLDSEFSADNRVEEQSKSSSCFLMGSPSMEESLIGKHVEKNEEEDEERLTWGAYSQEMGMASGLETICGQAYGAQQYQRIGMQTLNTISTLYTIPFGIGAAASTRVSNELGSGNSHGAYVAVIAGMSLAVIETSIAIEARKRLFDGQFSADRAFYLCGILIAALLAFWVQLGGKGIWIGIQDMEKGLLENDREADAPPSGSAITWTVFAQEVKSVGYLAAPMITVTLSQYFLQIISMTMVGHLGKLPLSSTAIAISLCAVSGFSVIFGMSCALETQCGQAYGAQQYRKFGVQIYTAIVSLTLACIPLSLLWMYLGKLLILLGQDPLISQEAGKFALCMIPALFAYASLQALVRYFLMQSLTTPLVISSSVTICFHIPFCWVLVFKFGFGNLGAAFSIGTSYWLNVILLGLYMKFSTECERTRIPISMELFHGIGEFFRFAIPSAGMICLEWWSFELLTLLSVYQSSQQSTQSQKQLAQQQVVSLLGGLFSTRVSNALGAGSPQTARVSVSAAMTLAASEAILVLGYVFSNEQDVVDYVTDMVPLLSLSVILDTLHGTLSGLALSFLYFSVHITLLMQWSPSCAIKYNTVILVHYRACGWQHLGVYVNLGAYYVLGIPIAAILGFWVQLRGKGLWIGILVGAFCQTVMLSLITSCTNWEKQAIKARERIFQRSFAVEGEL
ncbi:Protein DETOXIFICATION 12, partial [Mucuna pruriens]